METKLNLFSKFAAEITRKITEMKLFTSEIIDTRKQKLKTPLSCNIFWKVNQENNRKINKKSEEKVTQG